MFCLILANWQFPVFASAPGSKCLLSFCANAISGQRLGAQLCGGGSSLPPLCPKAGKQEILSPHLWGLTSSLFQHLWLPGWRTWIQASDGAKLFEPGRKNPLCAQASQLAAAICPNTACHGTWLVCARTVAKAPGHLEEGLGLRGFSIGAWMPSSTCNGLVRALHVSCPRKCRACSKPTVCGQQVQPEHAAPIRFWVLPVMSVLWKTEKPYKIFFLCPSEWQRS